MQALHVPDEDVPVKAENVPVLQVLHVPIAVAPLEAEYVPALQVIQAVPAVQYFPSGQDGHI